MKIIKLAFLLCISYFYNSIAMELTQQKENRTLEALSLELPKYPLYQYPTNHENSLKNITRLMRIFDKTTEKNNIGFSFLKILKTEYEKLDKQKAILMARFDLTPQQKNLILQQEKARLAQLEEQLVEKSTELEQLIKKANDAITENKEIKLQLQDLESSTDILLTALMIKQDNSSSPK